MGEQIMIDLLRDIASMLAFQKKMMIATFPYTAATLADAQSLAVPEGSIVYIKNEQTFYGKTATGYSPFPTNL